MGNKSDLTIRIEPRAKRVRSLLPEVIDQLGSLIDFLRSLTDEETTFEVISISSNSPVTTIVRPLMKVKLAAPPEGIDGATYTYKTAASASGRAAKTLEALSSGARLPGYADPYALIKLRSFAEDLKKSGHVATITKDNRSHSVDDRLIAQIDGKLGTTRVAQTSFTGQLGRIQAHGSKWSFAIYPVAGPPRILCYFAKDQIEQIRGLLMETVTVKGRALYRSRSPLWPTEIRVDTVSRRTPAPDGFWNELPDRLERDWGRASQEDRELLSLGAWVA